MNKLIVKKAAVLGAGVMGAQIAAHLANANVPVVLFDLPAKEGDKNGIVKKALDGLKKDAWLLTRSALSPRICDALEAARPPGVCGRGSAARRPCSACRLPACGARC